MKEGTWGARLSATQLARHVGARAKEARKRAALTQEDVAERVGLATEVYARLERGGMLPSVRTLRKLCRALGMDSNAVLALSGGDTSPAPRRGPPPRREDSPAVRRLLRRARAMEEPLQRLLAQVAQHLSQQHPRRWEPERPRR